MRLYIYNTYTREKEPFIPLIEEWKKDFVWVYSCWPTVYNKPHIGNLRAYVFADILRNTLRFLGYPVRYVVNITDVWHLTDDADEWEDKVEKAAEKEKISAWDIARKYEKIFIDNLKKLNIELFDYMPRATEHIQEQIEIIKKLEQKWYTYITEDWVYFDTTKFLEYWKLARLDVKNLKWWARVELGHKKNITDFALWKFSPKDKKRQMEWDSPWWKWFPWWHIECSAMSWKYLWDQFDIHTWWVDHIPVHHTNEIAQSEWAFWKKPWVKYWLHVQHLLVDWQKMSKSLWNIIVIDDIIEKWYSPLDLRYFYLTWHYRSFLDFTWQSIDNAYKARKNLIKKISESLQKNILEEKNQWISYILDDFDTPWLLAYLHTNWDNLSINEIQKIDDIIKLDLLKEAKKYLDEKKNIPYEIINLAEQRWDAKQRWDYVLADEIRKIIIEKWYKINDKKDWYEIEKII